MLAIRFVHFVKQQIVNRGRAMSSIHCPYCGFEMVLKGAKPGRYSPACTMCKEKFSLLIPMETDGVAVATALQRKAVESAAATATMPAPAAVNATAAPPPRAVSTDTVPSAHSSSVAAVATQSPRQILTMPAAEPPPPPEPMPEITGRLGGYEVKHKLGQGGMGAVYLARQISLDRDVALKVLAPRLAADPDFVSRFTREAYAAAQLTHHNVVQIHDIGVEKSRGTETNYFSMEFVEGQTLAGVVKESGKVDAEAAVGYILQAARGLKFAHDHGLIHRDIKPDNLLLNDQGVVKVADLGLVKRAGVSEKTTTGAADNVSAGTTQMSVSMGTPAYMPPEQARDAAAVDMRADIYSLGCTLYDLLTGRPPFTGHSAIEVMTKHATEAPVPPDRLAKHVPGALSFIVMKMMAKTPQDRYQNMAEVITALEGWLGVESGKPFSPKEQHVKVIEYAAERFNDSKWNKMRTLLIRAFFALSLLAIVVLALPMIGHPLLAAGMVGFVLATVVIYQIIHGVSQQTFLLSKGRQLVFSSGFFDWLTYLAVIAVGVLLIVAFGLQWVWLGFAVAAACAAAAFYFSIDLLLAKDREAPLLQSEKMLKEMRLHGLDENSLRQFVCKYSGQRWEEFYEALFGYEAKMLAREHWGRGDRGRNRPKYAAWRESIIAWIEHKMRHRQQNRERKLLAKLEVRAMAAKGIDQKVAAKQARKNADRFVDKAAAVRETAIAASVQTAVIPKAKLGSFTVGQADMKAISADWMHDDSADDGSARKRKHGSYLGRRYGSPLDVVFGQAVRLLLGLAILAGFAQWWNQNGGQDARKQAADMLGSREEVTVTAQKKDVSAAIVTHKDLDFKVNGRQPLQIKFVPRWICDAVGSWNGGIAGALLVLSVVCSGKILGFAVLLSAAIALFGERLNVPAIQTHSWIAAVAACVLWVVSVVLFRRTRGA
jgi:eukaryotic-like serine/threonine-protein kinase